LLVPVYYHPEVSIGRVVTAQDYRGTGLGIQLMEKTMNFTKNIFGNKNIRISAQEHLQQYYQKFGFKSTGKQYLEDGIPHVEMLYLAK
jgi:ElaA protein